MGWVSGTKGEQKVCQLKKNFCRGFVKTMAVRPLGCSQNGSSALHWQICPPFSPWAAWSSGSSSRQTLRPCWRGPWRPSAGRSGVGQTQSTSRQPGRASQSTGGRGQVPSARPGWPLTGSTPKFWNLRWNFDRWAVKKISFPFVNRVLTRDGFF